MIRRRLTTAVSPRAAEQQKSLIHSNAVHARAGIEQG
jgi:hypothetical protein